MLDLPLEIAKIFMDKLIYGGVKELRSFSQIKSHIKTLEEIKPIVEAWLLNADATQITSYAQLSSGASTSALEARPEELVEFNRLISALEKVHDSLNVREARAEQREIMSRSRPIKKVLLFFSPSNPIICRLREAREVKALIEELDRIARTQSQLGRLLRPSFETASQKKALSLKKGPFTSQVVIGRDKDRDNIIRMLLESSSAQETFSVVCIVGIGGMGKTTLAQYVFSDGRMKSHFDMMIWVYVPQILIAEDVIQDMVAFATDETHLQGGMHLVAFATDEIHRQGGMLQLQCHFQRQITNKKFLLVLDNVWDHKHLCLQWQALRDLIGFGAPGSMVLTTTRSVGVAKTMGIVNPYMLNDLAKEDSWDLFKRVAFTPGQDPRVEAIGREIVQMCPNVPLVICNTGHHLKGKCDISEWVDFKDRLSLLRSCRQAPNVMEILKLSYDELDPKLKLCFAYYSLFPKGREFFEDKLIHFWIALGYVESQSENQNLVDIARDYIRRLRDQGFFNYVRFGSFMMHDVIHDLAVWVAGPTYKRVYSSEGLEFGDDRIRHLCIVGDTDWPPKDSPYSRLMKMTKQLQSLIVLRGYLIKPFKRSLPHFKCLRVLSIAGLRLNEMPRIRSKLITLRYLDLSRNNFRKLPDSVTQLVNLTYLALSSCMKLEELPRGLSKLQNLLVLLLNGCCRLQKLPIGISKLTNLRTLDLSHCGKLEELTRDMSKLVKLRELHLRGCQKLRHMPVGLGNCTGLQKLEVFVAKGRSLSGTNPKFPNHPGDSDDYEVGRLAELNGLNNLQGRLRIELDGTWLSESEARAANLQGKEKLTGLEIHFVGGSSRNNEMMLEGFQPNANLRELWIDGYRGERIPSWIDDNDYLSNLKEIRICDWGTCVCLGSFGRLPHLENLCIEDLPNLEYIESTTTDPNALSAAPLFPSLEGLFLKWLPKLKGWRTMCASSCSGSAAIIFPRLRWLHLERVGLEIVPEEFQGVSSLEYIDIRDCNLLKGIPEWVETLSSLKCLHIYYCPQLTSSPEQMVKLSNFHFERKPYFSGKEWFIGERRGNGSTSS